MTQSTTDRLKRLLKLADIAQEFEFVDLNLVNHFSALREEFGLAKLLLLIATHVKETSVPSHIVETQTPETPNPNQDLNVVQRM